MVLPELHTARLLLSDGTSYSFFDPKLFSKKGRIFLSGTFDKNAFTDIKDFENKLQLRRQSFRKEDMLSVIGNEGSGVPLRFDQMIPVNVNYIRSFVKFACYGQIDEIMEFNKSDSDYIYSFAFEGLSVCYNLNTTTSQERTIFAKKENVSLRSTKDFIEGKISFSFKNKRWSLGFALLEGKADELIYCRLSNECRLDSETYSYIKAPLQAFFSFASGNSVNIRIESFFKDGIHHRVIYSKERTKKKVLANYIPINDHSFLNEDILNKYVSCFENFLFLDEHLDLSKIISLFNQAKKATIENSIILMLVVLEKLADSYVKSKFFRRKINTVINESLFLKFKSDLAPVFNNTIRNGEYKESKVMINDLWSRICNLNRKGKTEDKIEALLDFAEVTYTEQVRKLVTELRNNAIHEGVVEHSNGTAYQNRLDLELLINDIIANLIHYRGHRLIRYSGENKAVCNIKSMFRIDYADFGFEKGN